MTWFSGTSFITAIRWARHALSQRLGRVRAELASPHYHGSAQASELDEQVEEFGRDTIVSALHDLPASPG